MYPLNKPKLYCLYYRKIKFGGILNEKIDMNMKEKSTKFINMLL